MNDCKLTPVGQIDLPGCHKELSDYIWFEFTFVQKGGKIYISIKPFRNICVPVSYYNTEILPCTLC